MALTPDNRLNAVRCAWDRTENNSMSRLEVNGTTVRKNLFSIPIAKDIDSVAPVSFPAGTTLDVAFAFVEETTKLLPPFSGDTKGEELLSLYLSLSTNPSRYGLAA